MLKMNLIIAVGIIVLSAATFVVSRHLPHEPYYEASLCVDGVVYTESNIGLFIKNQLTPKFGPNGKILTCSS